MTEPIITTRKLTRRFDAIVAVNELDLEVAAGEIFGFLGHNGAGKTTTVRLLNGVLAANGGSARVLGLDPAADGPALRSHTGVLTATPALDERLSAHDNLSIYADLYGVPRNDVAGRVDDLLRTFDLAGRASDKVGEFSKGMKQRLALARALLHRPDLLFLDEPTSGLDPVAARQVHDMISHLARDEGRTIFLCTHNLVEAQNLCDRVAVMEHGRLVALGTPQELARQIVHNLTVAVEVAPDDAGRAEALLQGQPMLAGASLSRKESVFSLSGLRRDAIPAVVFALAAAHIRLYRVAPQEATLEDVYFALHGRQEVQG